MDGQKKSLEHCRQNVIQNRSISLYLSIENKASLIRTNRIKFEK